MHDLGGGRLPISLQAFMQEATRLPERGEAVRTQVSRDRFPVVGFVWGPRKTFASGYSNP